MPHNLNIENGEASMMFVGKTPWHQLGTRLNRPATAAEAIKAARLDWNVMKQPLYAGNEMRQPLRDYFAVVRDDHWQKGDAKVLGIVGREYTPLQNSDAFAFFDPIVGKSAAIYHTAGALGQGELIWVLAKLPGNIRVIGDDIVGKYLLLSNSHHGKSSVQLKFTPIRVVCENTLTMALRGGPTIRAAHKRDLPRQAATPVPSQRGRAVCLMSVSVQGCCYQPRAYWDRLPSSGPDAANTQSKTMVYDSATFNSTAMSNPKGRLVEAYTGASGSKTTDEFFSYSVRGELTDTYECTPHSGTNGCASVNNYYRVTAGFWANGALNTLSSNISGLPSQTYGVDGMGRTNAVSASAGQSPVNGTGTSYDLANYKTTVKYGSGDSDVVTLDQYTGRMKGYTFNVGSNSDTGTTTWNPNGSLASLQITDTVTGTADTQTCSYIHDDLSRISSVNCLNGSTNKWNQAFTYDAFGNITKTTNGPGISFMPNYDTSKNWITSLPGPITTTTDNNGQMTYDGVHNYTWDAEGKMHSVDANPSSCSTSGECLTYDALGRIVEKTVGNTYTQIVYGPQGNKFATMNGQTLVSAFIPLPGAQAVYTSASLNTSNKVAYYRHADHLGSSRLATTPTQTMYSSTAYAPDGEPYSQAGATDLSFTGQDQGTVSGMHDFLFRNFMPVQGRWLSPDPGGLDVADPANPQSWNRYAYVLNNPMALVDPFGLDPQCYSGETGQPIECNGAEPGTYIFHSQGSAPRPKDPPSTPQPQPPSMFDASLFVVTLQTFGPNSQGVNSGGGTPSTPKQPCNRLNAFKLDYSYVHPDGRTTKDHIIQDHTGGTAPGKSQYNGGWPGIRMLNTMTYLFGTQTVQGTSVVVQFSFPQFLAPDVIYHFGRTPDGSHTATNRVVTVGDCKTVLTSYLVP